MNGIDDDHHDETMTDLDIPDRPEVDDSGDLNPAGSGISDFLYPLPSSRDTRSIIRWWEKRRLPFNLIVGAAGMLTVGLASIAAMLPPNAPGPGFFWIPIVIYGVMANVCYTLGPAIEILMQKLWGSDVRPAGPALFRMGLTFSLGLTLLFPTIIIVVDWVLRVIGWIF